MTCHSMTIWRGAADRKKIGNWISTMFLFGEIGRHQKVIAIARSFFMMAIGGKPNDIFGMVNVAYLLNILDVFEKQWQSNYNINKTNYSSCLCKQKKYKNTSHEHTDRETDKTGVNFIKLLSAQCKLQIRWCIGEQQVGQLFFYWWLEYLFALFGSASVKTARKHVDEIDPK